ncbi:hypothetical protein Peur_070883 [Populus x canadensis]
MEEGIALLRNDFAKASISVEQMASGSSDDLLSSAAACIETEAAAAAGNAVYMLPSMYNHDCGKLSLFLAYARLDYKGKLC